MQNHHISGGRAQNEAHISFRYRYMSHALFISRAGGKIHNFLQEWTRDMNEGTKLCRIVTLAG